MKTLLVLGFTFLFFSRIVFAQNDLEVTMKNMALSYKNTMQAQDIQTFNHHLYEFKKLVFRSKEVGFPAEKKAVSIEGVDKVIVLVEQAEKFAMNGQLIEAQVHLKSVDRLRKEYHKHHEPSFWQLIFGS